MPTSSTGATVASVSMQVECLFEDDELFVLNKPSGMPVHRDWANDETALVDFARAKTEARAAHPIQRLDRGASGAVLFAKNSQLAQALSIAAHDGLCQKAYLAVVRGEIQRALDIDHAIPRREDGPRVNARTLVYPVATTAAEPRAVSLVLAIPLTGRLHQVRRHLKHANHPLIGDVRYGRGELNRAFRERYQLRRLALHAYAWSVTRQCGTVSGLVSVPSDLGDPLHDIGFNVLQDGFIHDATLPALACVAAGKRVEEQSFD